MLAGGSSCIDKQGSVFAAALDRAEDINTTGGVIRVLKLTADVLRSDATFEVLEAMTGS